MGVCDEEAPQHPPAGKTRDWTAQGEVSRTFSCAVWAEFKRIFEKHY